MSYELREHTADVAVAATGDTLGAVFANIADGLAAAQCDELPPTGERFTLEETAESRESLLFDFLDRLIYERDIRNVLPTDHDATVSQKTDTWHVHATARGVPLTDIEGREIKAVTYSDMNLTETPDGWTAYVVFDV